tara:strand:+ start:142 stop:477 length:336 start_codon:yes stop_codon:yes gene_type:complete
MADINTHAEALKSIFKKIFSGQYTYGDGSKSVDVLKGKEDLKSPVDWSLSEYDLDRFDDYIYNYVFNQKLNENDIEALIEEFFKSDLVIDETIGWEIQKLWEGEMFHFDLK